MRREMIDFHGTEAALVESLHDDAMSGPPVKACTSRGLKELLPPLVRWLEREAARGTEPADLCVVAADVAVSVMVTIIQNSAPRMDNATTAAVVKALSAHLPAALADVAAHFRNPSERRCRSCGCTDTSACITDDGPCAWSEPDLCSACAVRPQEPQR